MKNNNLQMDELINSALFNEGMNSTTQTGIILLTKATSVEKAKMNAHLFLKKYEGEVYSHYVIGGLLSGRLTHTRRRKLSSAISEFAYKLSELGIMINEHERKIWINKLEEILFKQFGTALRLRDPYEKDGYEDDVIPLSQCLEAVKERVIDPLKIGSAKEKEALLQKELGNDFEYRRLLAIANTYYRQEFSFETHLFNIETSDYSIPNDVENYYALMVEMHGYWDV